MPPNVLPITVGGSDGELFTAGDVLRLARRYRLQRSGIDSETIARELNECFDAAMFALRHQNAASAPSERQKWFDDVSRKAGALLRTMGFTPGEETLNAHDLEALSAGEAGPCTDETHPALSNLKHALVHAHDFLPPYPFLPAQVRNAVKTGPGTNNSEADLSAEVALAILEASPWIVALIAEVARKGAAHHKTLRKGGGDRKDIFKKTLFVGLARIFKHMTGEYPAVRDASRDRDPNAPAAKWARGVCEIAAGRAKAVFPPPSAIELKSVRDVSMLKGDTLAAHLEAGTRELKPPRKSAHRV